MSPRAIKTLASVIGGILLTLGFVVGGCGIMLSRLSDSICKSEIFRETYSPNGLYKAIVFQRSCGATTGFRTHISVLKHDEILGSKAGNVFQADGDPDWFSIKIVWKDDQHLVIEHNGKAIPDIVKNKIGGIQVIYIENLDASMPPRPFKPRELLLPVSFFPSSWRGKEFQPFGPEVIKGSKENNPYMLYTPPFPAEYPKAGHYITRLDNVDQTLEYFHQELKDFSENHSESCAPPDIFLPDELVFKSGYSKNYAIGYAEHRYSDGSGDPECMLIAQYDEFFIEFRATVSDNGLTYEDFNELVKIIDEIMTSHLQQ